MLLDLQQSQEHLVTSVLTFMSLLEFESTDMLLGYILRLLEERDIEGDGQSEDLNSSHLPQITALLLVVHPNHHGQRVLVEGYQLPPLVQQTR